LSIGGDGSGGQQIALSSVSNPAFGANLILDIRHLKG